MGEMKKSFKVFRISKIWWVFVIFFLLVFVIPAWVNFIGHLPTLYITLNFIFYGLLGPIVPFILTIKLIVYEEGIKESGVLSKGQMVRWEEIKKINSVIGVFPSLTIFCMNPNASLNASKTFSMHLAVLFNGSDLCQLIEIIKSKIPNLELGPDIEAFQRKYSNKT